MPLHASFTFIHRVAGAQNKTGADPWSFATIDTCTAGSVCACAIALDNDGDGIADDVVGVTDDSGNTWTVAIQLEADPGAAAAGAAVAIAYTKATTTIALGANITVDLPASTVAKYAGCIEFTMESTNVLSVEFTQTATSTGATCDIADQTGLTDREHLFLFGGAREDDVNPGVVGTGYSAAATANATSGGGSASNMGGLLAYRIATATSSNALSLTADGSNADAACALAVVNEDAPPATVSKVPRIYVIQ
jgi:hypothetical protein